MGATFIALAVYVVAQSAYALAPGHEPGTSMLGLGMAVVAVNPALGFVKQRAFEKTREMAFALKELLEQLRLSSFAKTTGKTGLHIYVPVLRQYTYDEIRAASAAVPWIAREGVEGLRGE